MDLRQYAGYHVQEHIVMHNDDLKAVNTEANPDNVAPKTGGDANSGKCMKYGILRGDLDCNRNRNGILPQKREEQK